MGVCTFCGHGHIYGSYDAVQQECYTTVENLIKTGDVDCFLIGNYGDFDSIAASVCLSLKKQYPHITVSLVLPYYRPHLDDFTKERYNKFDYVITPEFEETPHKYRIIKANEYMVDRADTLIAYVKYGGGAEKTLKYAKKQNRTIINLGGVTEMKKRLISLLLCLVLVLSLGTTAFAASDEASSAAGSLYALGLFNGTGTDKNGNPTYDLDLTPTRNQAVTMLVRLLGKSAEAETQTWTTPFTDVDEWAKAYVGYAYANGLTAGTSATTYSGNANTTVKQYLTFILRALGYNSSTDFEYDKAWEFSDSVGLTDGRYNANTASFTRGDIAYISYSALKCNLKNSNTSLLQKLYDEGVVTYEGICQSGLSEYTTVKTIPAPSHLSSKTGSDNDAVLSWTAPDGDVTGYDLYVSTSKYGKYSLYQTGFSTYASLIEHTLKAGVTYFAKVQAFQLNEVVDKYGNTGYEEIRSEFSNATSFVIPSSGGGTIAPDNPSSTIPIEQLVLTDKTLSITPGEVIDVAATCIPMYAYPELTWTSSNPAVATVQYVETVKKENVYNGTTYDDAYTVKAKITAISAGNATITVIAQNGVKATINVSVFGDNVAKAQAAVDALRSILKFPASLSLNSVRIYQGNSTAVVEIDYSAMNGFGGYNRGYFHYSGTTSSTSDYSIIDRYGYPYVTVDISQLK